MITCILHHLKHQPAQHLETLSATEPESPLEQANCFFMVAKKISRYESQSGCPIALRKVISDSRCVSTSAVSASEGLTGSDNG